MVPLRGMELGTLCAVHMPTRLGGHGGQRDRADLRKAQWPLTLGPTFPAAPLDTLCALTCVPDGLPEEIFLLTGTQLNRSTNSKPSLTE